MHTREAYSSTGDAEARKKGIGMVKENRSSGSGGGDSFRYGKGILLLATCLPQVL